MLLKVLLILTFVHGRTALLSRDEDAEKAQNFFPKIDLLKAFKVCYDDLGCFHNGGPFFDLKRRPLQVLPQMPRWINTKFYLHTRRARGPQELDLDAAVANRALSPGHKTKIIVHGFSSNSDVSWMNDMKDALLLEGDFNVILVDWRRGALPPYTQATANTRVVGAQIALLIKRLMSFGTTAKNFHIIGHSLGAHISGYAGRRTEGLGRISGLDPAEPYFQFTHKDVRLDPSDALFVDVIHTDADHIVKASLTGTGGFGTKEVSGHVDFFPNGGYNQPGCSHEEILTKSAEDGIQGLIEGVPELIACDHGRANELYIESIKSKSCRFTAVPCPSYAAFKRGECRGCGRNGCSRMGYFADTAKPRNDARLVAYALDTTAEKPFCLNHYFVSVIVRRDQRPVTGSMAVQLHGRDGPTEMMPVSDESILYEPGKEYRFVVTSPLLIERTQALTMLWRTESGIGVLALDTVVIATVANDLTERWNKYVMKAPLLADRTYTQRND